MEKLNKNSLKSFAQKRYGKAASDRLAEEITITKKVSGQTVRNWFSGRSVPVSKEYFSALACIWPDVNPHTFFIFDEFSK